MSDELRRDRLAAVAVGVIVLLSGVATATPHLFGVFFDDALYLLIAKAVAEGQGLVYPQLPGTPPAIHYPPGFSLLLAALWKVAPPFPESTAWFKLVNPLLLGVAAYFATLVARRALGLGLGWTVAVVLLGFISVPTLMLTGVLLSEPMFLALLFPTLLAAQHALDGGTREAMLAGVLAAALVLTRTLGVAVLPAVLVALLVERRLRTASVFLATAVIVVLPWQVYVWRHSAAFPDLLRGTYGPYLAWVLDGYKEGGARLVGEIVLRNLQDAWGYLGLQFALLVRSLRPAAAASVILLGLAGVVAGLQNRPTRVLAGTALAYCALVVAWPFQVERFLAGVWPLLLLLLALGAATLVAASRRLRLPPSPVQTALPTALLLWVFAVGAGQLTANMRGLSRGWASSASRQMADRMLPAIQFAVADPRVTAGLVASDIAPALALYADAQVVSLDVLRVTDHLRDKSLHERTAIVASVDRVFQPSAYVLLPQSPSVPALVQAERDPRRHFREITPAGLGVRVFLLDSAR